MIQNKCGEFNALYTDTEATDFSYTYNYQSSTGQTETVTIPLGGQSNYFTGGIQPGCPQDGQTPSGGAVVTDGSFYHFVFYQYSTGGSATMQPFNVGVIQPAYVVLSVIYAPPGAGSNGQSYVDYSNTTEAGTDTSLGSSFKVSNEFSVSGKFLGILSGFSSGWSQETDTSSSISINQKSTIKEIYTGLYPANTIGINHDNDIILLWLNPALDCAAENADTIGSYSFPSAVQCLRYDPSMTANDPDSPTPDVEQVPVGWLNGDFPIDLGLKNVLEAHGITSADYPEILSSDPYAACKGSVSCDQSVGVSSTRFDDDNVLINFEPLGNATEYDTTYNKTTTQGHGATHSISVSFTKEGGENFGSILSGQLKDVSTLTWTSKWSKATESMAGQSATAHITEPPPGEEPNAIQFKVYKDNVYGTFMFYPTQ